MILRYWSRHCAFAALLPLVLVAPVEAQTAHVPYVLSERVGPEIEPAERDYFGLVPGIRVFDGMWFEETSDGRVRMVVARDSQPDSVMVVDRSTAEALGRFVETFEQYEAAFYNPAWQVVSPYARADVPTPYVQEHGSVVAYVEDGYYAGHPVYASDSLLVLRRHSDFDWRSFEVEGVVVPASEIENVRIYKGLLGSRYAPLLGLPVGLLLNELVLLASPDSRDRDGLAERRIVGASLGVVAVDLLRIVRSKRRPYGEALPEVEAEAWFTSEARPPELPLGPVLERRAEDRPTPLPRWRSQLGWLDTGVGTVLASPAAQSYTFFSNFEGADAEQEIEFVEGIALETALALRPLSWLSAGIGVYAAPTPEVNDAGLQEVAYSKPSFRVFADVDLLRAIKSDSPVGVAVGGGLLRAESVVTQQFPENPITTYSPASYELRKRGFRPFYSATVEFGVLPETALFGRLLGWSAPDVDVPLTEVESVAFPGTVVYRVEPHTVEFGQIGFVAGIRAGL